MWVWIETRRITETVGSRSSSSRRANWRAATQAIQIRLLRRYMRTSLPFWGRKGTSKIYHFLVTDRRLAPLFTRDPPPTTTNAPTGFVPFERQFENEPRDGRVVRVPEDDRTANQPGPPPGIPPAAPTLQELNFGALRNSGKVGP